MQNASQPPTAPLPPDLEPDEEWKQALRINIEDGLRSMVDEAKQKLNDELAKGVISPEERERITAEHLAALKNIRQLAEEQFRIALERERQERRWASGEQLDREWSETMMKEQQAILDRIEKERKNKAPIPPSSGLSSQPDQTQLLPQPQPQPRPQPQPPPPTRQPDVIPENTIPSSSIPITSTPTRKVERERLSRAPTQIIDSERDTGPYFSRSIYHDRDDFPTSPEDIPVTRPIGKARAGSMTSSIGSYKSPSILETDKSFLERSKHPPLYDEPDTIPRSIRPPTDPPDSIRRESIRRKPSMTTRPIVQEFWKPSITSEEDVQMSRTLNLARGSSTASATSSFKASSVLSTTFTDPLDVVSSNVDKERSSINFADQEWSGVDRPRERERDRDRDRNRERDTGRERDREREREREGRGYGYGYGYGHPDDRPSHNGHRINPLEDRPSTTSSPLTSPNSANYARAPDNAARTYVPPPSASRPIINKKSFTLDDAFPPQSSPGSRNWTSRSPFETRWEGSSRSPHTPEDTSRSWQSSHLRGRFSSQDMRHHFLQEGSYHSALHVPVHHEDFGEDGSDDGFDNRSWQTRDYNERRIQDIEDGLRKREEAASKREEELAKRMEEIRREEEARKKKLEESKREEEARRLEEEARQREEDDDVERKAAELRKKEQEAIRRERIAAKKAEDARRLEEEAKRKDEEARRKAEEAKRLGAEAKRKEEEAKRLGEEAKRKEEEARKREREIRLKEEEARRKEEEVRKMEAEAKKKEDDVKKKEREARLKEEETKRKEKEVKSREVEARRKEEEVRRKEEEAARKEEEATFREMEARRLEEEARRKEEDAKRIEEEARRREQEARRKAEETRLKEEDMRRRADELQRREEDLRRREEDLIRREVEVRRREDDKQQEEFRRREEDIRRQRAEERKRQEVWETWPHEAFGSSPPLQMPGSSSPWPIPNRGNERSAPPPSTPPTDRMSTSASRSGTTSSGWSSTSFRSSSTTTASSQPSSTPTPKPPPATPNPPLTEAEFHRRQAEQAQQREEQFRREQARLAMQDHERQAKSGKTMSKEEVAKLFEAHRNQWDKIQALGALIWEDFPWPTFKRPKSPEELTSPAITAYMLSPIHPQDRGAKERIKDNIRRWHPDRFNSQYMPKVKESERDKVSEGAGTVARILNDLLRMNSQDIF